MRSRFIRVIGLSFIFSLLIVTVMITVVPQVSRSIYLASKESALGGWHTNTSKRLIHLDQLAMPGPGRDEIPAIVESMVVDVNEASRWLVPSEPVISLVINGRTRAYPLQILIWHGIVNDSFCDVPVAVTFCPLTYASVVYQRNVKGRKIMLGVSGMLCNSNMVMYDTLTQSLWQQFTGRAVVGDHTGRQLEAIPSQVISFGQFSLSYPDGEVLSHNTGFVRFYGANPYVGYDNSSNLPVMFTGTVDGRLSPMERVVSVNIEGRACAYPHYISSSQGAINDTVGETPLVVFHNGRMSSVLDKQWIKNSRRIGATGVFCRKIDGHELTFSYDGKYFIDDQTRSFWDVTGLAVRGKLAGKRLTPIWHLNSFAFAWLVFNPAGIIYE